MYVLLTGGAGFIGSATAELLSSKGYIPIIVDSLYSGSINNIRDLVEKKKAIFVKADVSNLSELEGKVKSLLKDAESVIHLAAMINVLEVMENPKRAFDVNVAGTLHILELSRRYDVERVVYASSVAVYGEPKELPIVESHPKDPSNFYGLTKLFGEELLWRYNRDYGLKPIALRYFNVYGPRMRPGPYSGVVYKFISSLLRGKRPTIYGDGEQTRDFVYVYDVAEANLNAMKRSYVGAVNIGSGSETSIRELLKIIESLINIKVEPEKAPPRPGDVRRSRADIRLAREKISWSPKTSLEEGLKRTIKYYKEALQIL